jgi:quinol monooxygenase YgiN
MATQITQVTKGLRVTLEAVPGKEAEVERFLLEGRAMVDAEPATIAWFAIRLGPTTFGIFDVFRDDAGRQAHLSGQVAQALVDETGKLFQKPEIEPVEVLASKLPG